MSQRTRARTTGAEPKRARGQRGESAPRSGAPEPAPTTPSSLAPEELARALRAVATELERDPALAARVAAAMSPDPEPAPATATTETEEEPPARSKRGGKTFQPRIITGAAPELGMGIPDPFALRAHLGERGLRAALDELRLGTLRAIVREHKLDPKGRLKGQNDEQKLRDLILAATAKA